MRDAFEEVCVAWETATSTEPATPVACRSGVVVPSADAGARFCYVSVASPIEQLLALDADVWDRSGGALTVDQLSDRLLAGEVAAVLASTAEPPANIAIQLSDAHRTRRQQIRHANVQMRFILRQIGLEEVSSHRGAPAALYEAAARTWSHDLALCTDPAMMLTLGADRQRYVDTMFNERAVDRLPRALGRLHDLGIRSYPRLVIV